jgi:hypothetical protein
VNQHQVKRGMATNELSVDVSTRGCAQDPNEQLSVMPNQAVIETLTVGPGTQVKAGETHTRDSNEPQLDHAQGCRRYGRR